MNFCKRSYQPILRYLYSEVKKHRREISLHKHFNQIRAPRQQYPPRFSTTHQDQERRRHSTPPRQCQYCGYNYRKSDHCPAFGKRCRKCNKENQFSSVYRSSGNLRVATRKQDSRSNDQSRQIKRTAEEDSPISSDDDYFIQAVTHSFQAKKIKATQRQKPTVTVRLDHVDTRMEPDSGAEVNLMDEHQFQALLHRTEHKPTLEPCQIKLNTLQHPLHVKRKFDTIICNQTCGKPATVVVVKGRINSPPLLSKDTLIEKPKTIKAAMKTAEQQEMDNIITKYNHVFQGIGKITDKKNYKEIYGQFHMKPDAIPVTQRPRPVPYHLKRPLKEWLRQGVEGDIFELVPENEPVTWCSPLVIQPKPKFAHTPKEEFGPDMIRASVDLRVPNQHMERSQVTQTLSSKISCTDFTTVASGQRWASVKDITNFPSIQHHARLPLLPPQWEITVQIAIDFGGPYPGGHYNLVAIDKRTRYTEVTYTTSSKPTQAKLKRMFGHHGIPQRVDSDNGLPFNSEEFAQFAAHEGFVHHRITPEHPRANREAERFMQTLNRTEQIAHLQGKHASQREIAEQDMLTSYRDTPHPATGVTPYEALHGRPIRTRLDREPGQETAQGEEDKKITEQGKEYKKRMTQLKRNVKKHIFALKDYVLLKQKKSNKWTKAIEPAFYTITKIEGSSNTIKRIKDGRELCRDASQLKLENLLVGTDEHSTQPADKEDEESTWARETDDEMENGDVENTRPPEDQNVENEVNNRIRRERRLPVRLRDYILS